MRMDIGTTVHNILAYMGTTIHIVGLARGYHHVRCLDRVDTTINMFCFAWISQYTTLLELPEYILLDSREYRNFVWIFYTIFKEAYTFSWASNMFNLAFLWDVRLLTTDLSSKDLNSNAFALPSSACRILMQFIIQTATAEFTVLSTGANANVIWKWLTPFVKCLEVKYV